MRLLQVYTIVILCAVPGLSISSFLFSPIDANGGLTTCVGTRILLTCSHDNDANGITRWVFSPPVDCSETIDHNPPIFTRPCGPFSFHNITEIGRSNLFNSSATATVASTLMSGTVVGCRDSSGDVYNEIGRASICIIDQPTDLTVTDGKRVVWKGPTCIGAAISYRVEISRLNDSQSVDVILTAATEILLSNLQSNQEYSVSVITLTSTCSTDPATETFTLNADATQSEDQRVAGGVGVGIAVVAVSIVAIVAVTVAIILIIKFHFRKSNSHLIDDGVDSLDMDKKARKLHDMSKTTIQVGDDVTESDGKKRTAHELVLLKLNEYHERNQTTTPQEQPSNHSDTNSTEQESTECNNDISTDESSRPSDNQNSAEIVSSSVEETNKTKVEEHSYATPIPRPKNKQGNKSSSENSKAPSSSKAPPKPPRLRVGSSRAALSPSHHALVDNQVLSDQDM